ncbi:MAG: hypothetical protein PHQ83_12690 [Eubacteriales bacterium]|nr:hypothetical protein [Eubacteriales bacterium]
MNLFRNKFLIGLICIALGLAVGFLAIPKLTEKEIVDQMQAIRLKQSIPEGTLITDEMVESVQVGSSLVPESVITDLALVSNRFSAVPIFAGDYLTEEKLTDVLAMQDPMSVATAKGLKVISITLPSLASGVSGQLKPGDVVTILASKKQALVDQTQTLGPKETDQSQSTESKAEAGYDSEANVAADPELQYVEVCSLTASDGRDAVVNKTLIEDEKNQLPVTISLFVTTAQAKLLADFEQNYEIHLSFVARGKEASQFIADNLRVIKPEEA